MAHEINVNCTLCQCLAGDTCTFHGVELDNPAYTVCTHFREPGDEPTEAHAEHPGLADLGPDWIYEIDAAGEPTPLVQVARRRRSRPGTGKLATLPDLPEPQAAPPSDLLDRFSGALVGLGVGEALGFPAEGRSPADIEMIYGGPLTGYVARIGRRHTWPPAQVAKDTQLALLLGASLIEHGGALDMDDVAERLVRWLPSALKPGKSTVQAIQALGEGRHWAVSGIDSNGAGATTRVVPLALLRHRDYGRLRQEAILQSVVTHVGTKALAGAALFATAIAALANTPRGTLDRPALLQLLERAIRGIDPVASARLHDVTLALDAGSPPAEVLARIKTGGFVLECLPSALYCFLRQPDDPQRALLLAVNAGFDACATGAMTGALAGAYLGRRGLPPPLVNELPVLGALDELAGGLHAMVATPAPTPAG